MIKYNKLGKICGKYYNVMLQFVTGYLVQNRKKNKLVENCEEKSY